MCDLLYVTDGHFSNMHKYGTSLTVNKLSELNKRVSTEAAVDQCSVAVLKNQKQPLADVLQNRCS